MLAIVKLLLTVATLVATYAVQAKGTEQAEAEAILRYLRAANDAIARASAARQRVRNGSVDATESELDEHDPYRRD